MHHQSERKDQLMAESPASVGLPSVDLPLLRGGL